MRWPADDAISVTTPHIQPKHAPIAVNAGTLHVIKVVRNGKEIGTYAAFVGREDEIFSRAAALLHSPPPPPAPAEPRVPVVRPTPHVSP